MNKHFSLLILAVSAFITSNTNTSTGLLDKVKGFFSGQRDLPLSVSGLNTSKPVRDYDPARRIHHWKTTIAALKAYGISRDAETMRWAYHNLNRAENAQPYGRAIRRRLGSTPYKKQLGRTINDRTSHARTSHPRTSKDRTIHVRGYDRTAHNKAKTAKNTH